MGNALFYGACGFAVLIFNVGLGVLIGKFFARRRLAYKPAEKEEGWRKSQVWDPWS